VSLILITCLFSSMLNCLLGRCVSMYCLFLSLPRSLSLSLSLSLLRWKSSHCVYHIDACWACWVCTFACTLFLFRCHGPCLDLLRCLCHTVTFCFYLSVFLSLPTHFLVSTAFSSTIVVVVHDRSSHLRRLSRGSTSLSILWQSHSWRYSYRG
jgi:hypothetical protein